MGNELKLNSAEEAEVILIRLTPEEYPIAYANKVKCLMLSGLSKKEAERMAMEPIDLELYYEVGVGLMAVMHRGAEFRHGLVEDITGHQWSLNRYENDLLTAGCHRIAYNEMERIAKRMCSTSG